MKARLWMIVALLVCASVMVWASSAEEDPASETIHFTGTGVVEIKDGVDYMNDAVYDFMNEKFNFTYELYPLTWGDWLEKNRLWITSGDMPDITMWDVNYTEYLAYAEQGLIAPLPEDWETRYPNLSYVVEQTGIKEKLTLDDGRIYAVPKALYAYFAPFTNPVQHTSIYYRDDVRQQLGMEPIDGLMTLDELRELVLGAKENGYAKIGLTIQPERTRVFMHMANTGYDRFYKEDGRYVWGPAQPETLDGIRLLRELYQEGVIESDFYLNETENVNSKFMSGLAPAMIDAGHIYGVQENRIDFRTQNPDSDPWEDIKVTALAGPDGRFHGVTESANFWTATVFNPDIDPVKQDRILAMLDYLATPEGQELISLGIEGVDWERVGDGYNYNILREKNPDGTYPLIKEKYPSIGFWLHQIILVTDFSFVDPTHDPRSREAVLATYEAKLDNGDILSYDPDYEFYVSDAKSRYSVDVESEIVRIVLDDSLDIEEEWAAFVEEQKPIWEPLLNELNAEFGE
jgi:putative aldouronate transport system substrate-binding protein